MKLPSFAASAIGVAVVAASAFAAVAPASAATPGVVYVSASDIAPGAPNGTIGWNNIGTAALSSSINGLTADNDAELIYSFVSPVGTVGGSTLANVGASTYFYVSDDTAVYAEIGWYTDAAHTDDEFFYADEVGAGYFNDPTDEWVSTVPVGSIPAYTLATLAEFDAQLASDVTLADASIYGVGAYNAGGPVDFYTFLAGGNQTYFTPAPVVTGAPATIGQTDFGTAGKGYPVTTTGFVPNETVTAYLSTPESTSDPISLVADANGTVTYRWVYANTSAPVGGNFVVEFFGDSSNVSPNFQFTIVAQAALAATGSDVTAPVIAGGVLLLGGAALAIVATKRRKTATV